MTDITDLFGIDVPIVQAPMANAAGHELAAAVASAGGLGSIGCGPLDADAIRAELAAFRRAAATSPVNLNFLCPADSARDAAREAHWRAQLEPYYRELAVEAGVTLPPGVPVFDAARTALVEELRPEVVSFHFGLPHRVLLERVRATGAKIISSATTVAEAQWLEDKGVNAIIAQGFEAGGHRGLFLSDDVGTQVGTLALVPQIVDAVNVPVIAAGGITDARGIVAAFALGAAGVQIGTAYLRCPEARTSPVHRAALAHAHSTRLSNIFTGLPARVIENRFIRELGAMRTDVPAFPKPLAALAPFRAAAEARGSSEFSPLYAGQAAALARELGAAELTRTLAREARELASTLAGAIA